MLALIPLFFLTALVYSMAGFGGGSTYLALLVLFDLPHDYVRTTALLCNVAVVSFSTWHFARAGHLKLQKVMPFMVTSVPMAWWGGNLQVSKTAFTLLLGMSLVVAAARMLWIGNAIEPAEPVSTRKTWIIGAPIGAALGLLAGMVGIGGGIYLAPVLLFLGWANAKEMAAAASCFILVNSLAGLAGQAMGGIHLNMKWIVPLLIAVVLGGQIGSRLGSYKLPKLAIQRISGILLLLVSCRLLWGLI